MNHLNIQDGCLSLQLERPYLFCGQAGPIIFESFPTLICYVCFIIFKLDVIQHLEFFGIQFENMVLLQFS